jgi:cell division protease FtsH
MNSGDPRDAGTDDRPGMPRDFWRWMVVAGLLGFLAIAWWQGTHRAPEVAAIPYSRFTSLVAADTVKDVLLQGDSVRGTLKAPMVLAPGQPASTEFASYLPGFGDDRLLPLLSAHQVTVTARPVATGGFTDILIAVIPWLLLIGFFYWSYRRTSQLVGGELGGQGRLGEFLKSGTQRAAVPEARFDDVAGQDNAKNEVAELVQYLRDPAKFARVGASAPRGVLLMGPPGTGKTLLARALAGEAGVPFFSISGSQFIEVFVGVGASRVRNLFAAARQNMPSIVFIDELDSIGRTRGTGLGGGHDEREQTLNQILAEMDGFTPRESVLVLAATNRPDILDPALLRPGRFDRHVVLDLPSRADREAILRVHVRKLPLATDVDLGALAAGTPGFSGADLHNLANEAAILAARADRGVVTRPDFEEARDKLLMGSVRRLAILPEERHRLAVHESGHALVASYLPGADPLHKVTIIPRGRALGETRQLPENERYTLPEDYLKDRLAVMLAGRAAERQLLGNVSSGADEDIRNATRLARAMVARWGMSAEVGPMDLRESEDAPFLGREIAQPRAYSEHAAEQVDRAVRALLVEAEARATAVVTGRAQQMQTLVAELEEKETLDRAAIEACLAGIPRSSVAAVV